MEGDEWHAQNTRRMDLVRNASICRRFINGSCRLGPRCSYRHEWPVIPPVQLCRYFPKGGCWYGERCRYLHVLPEVVAAVAGRRGSVPTVSSSDAYTPPDRGSVPTVSSSDASTPPDRGSVPTVSSSDAYTPPDRGSVPTVSSSDASTPPDRGSVPTVSSSDASTPPDRRGSVPTVFTSDAYTPPDRRGSKPALLQADVLSRPVYNRPQLVVNISNPPHNTGLLAADIAEEHSQDADSPVTASWELVQSSEAAQACAGRNEQETSNETMEDGAAAAAFSSRGTMEEMEAFLRSQNVTCGICMDKVYEKTDPRNHVFGILPNCNHAFCLQCIMTWRKTKDLGPDVVKSCPQCRVRSAFYVPNKHWVEGQAKESLIAAFKEKFSKRRCNYYSRYRCCPFKTECLYRHDKHAPRGSFPYYTEDEDYDGVDLINLFIAMTVLRDHNADDDDDDDVGFPFYLSEEYGV